MKEGGRGQGFLISWAEEKVISRFRTIILTSSLKGDFH